MVLADTSVWIAHLRSGNRHLAELLKDTEVLCHPFVVGELACGNMRNRKEILTLLHALPTAPVITQDEFLAFVDSNKLMGRGIGFVDVHLLASSRLAGVPIWTADKSLKATAHELKLNYIT